MYRAAKRDSNEQQIIRYLLRCGACVKQLDDPSVPDLLVAWKGVNLLLEVKSKQGKLTTSQQIFFSRWAGQKAVVRSIKDVKQVLRNASLHV